MYEYAFSKLESRPKFENSLQNFMSDLQVAFVNAVMQTCLSHYMFHEFSMKLQGISRMNFHIKVELSWCMVSADGMVFVDETKTK